ncbi:MAG: hypothetical protein ACLQGP_15355 [Isosphaeraceae bacterium]
MEEFFLGERHPVSGRTATFDDDGTSAWLYLSVPGAARVVADAWVYNRVTPPAASDVGRYRPGPPPAAVGFAGPDALCVDPGAHRGSLAWSTDGESVAVLRDGLALALIAQAGRPGYSRLLSRSGPWGRVWDEELYRAVMVDPD